jgi:hypothetical protein
VNLALMKQSWQISTYSTYGPSKANDGIANTNFNAGSCMSTVGVSNGDANPWWAVDLGRAYCVTGVNLTNRGADSSGESNNYFVPPNHVICQLMV